MVKTKKKIAEPTIEELTQKEISSVEFNDKLAKLEKEKVRDKKIIAEYKEREKATARALVLFERKIKWLRETLFSDVLDISKSIDEQKDSFAESCSKISNADLKEEIMAYSGIFSLAQDKLFDICNKIETNAVITKTDRDFISNRKPDKKANESLDSNSRFDRLKQEFAQKIGESVNRKPGRPKMSEQSVVSQIGLGYKPEKQVETDAEIESKLSDLFYSKPQQKSTVSAIPQTSDSIFDFNEALNPSISLKDIMADLMSEKEDVSESNENLEKLKEAQKKSKIELLESGFLRQPVVQKKDVEQKTIDQQKKKPTFEKRFLSIQDIVKRTN